MPRLSRFDVTLMIVVAALGVLVVVGEPARLQLPGVDAVVPPWVVGLLVVVSIAVIALKHRSPVAAVVVAVVVAVANLLVGVLLVTWIVLCDALYVVGERSSARVRTVTVVLASVLIVGLGVATFVATGEAEEAVSTGLLLVATLLVPIWWGVSVRQGNELTALAEERARLSDELAVEAARGAEAARTEAVAAERAAVARDLHDVVSARLSTIALHSAAALAQDPDAARDRVALASIREASLASIDEMRELIGVLRAGGGVAGGAVGSGAGAGPADGPARGLDLVELASWADGAGLAVELRVDESLVARLPASTSDALAPIAREALVNALKYGDGSVRIAFDPSGGDAVLVVENPFVAGASRLSSGGAGIDSMRARVLALGGTMHAGAVEGETSPTWRVAVSVPVDAGVSS